MSDEPLIRISGSRFAFTDIDVWYDTSDQEVRDKVLRRERSDLVWDGPQGLWVVVAGKLREAGMLTEPPLPASKYVNDLRELSEEAGGEYLPDYIRRIRRELAELKGE